MASNLSSLSCVTSRRVAVHAAFDGDGNHVADVVAGPTTVEDTTDYNLFDFDLNRAATVNLDVTALNLGGYGSSHDWTGATAIRLILEYISGTGSVAVDGTVTNGLGTGIGVATLSSTYRYIDRTASGISVDGTHKACNLTVTGTIAFKIIVLGKV